MSKPKPKPIIILHGWSDSSESFEQLKQSLGGRLNRPVDEINLLDWVSMDDDISYDDIAAALDNEWTRKGLSRQPHSVDFVVHSTGALVLRHWMVNYFTGPTQCPAHRILMLAPANYGSYLADEGKSFMGKIIKGGFSDTGKKLLDGLELASNYTQDLANLDVLNSWFKPSNGIFVSVIVGDGRYGGLSGLTHKDGSDNTVMVPCANLECLQVDYTIKQTPTNIRNKNYKTQQSFKTHTHSSDTAFCVLKGLDHSEVTGKKGFKGNLLDLMVNSLSLTKPQWRQHKELMAQCSNLAANPYANVVLAISDQLGQAVEKYVMFMSVRDQGQSSRSYKAKGIEDVHRFKPDASRRAFYVNTKDLFKSLKMGSNGERSLVIKIVADPACDFGESKKPSAGFLNEDRSPEIVITPEKLSKVIRPGFTTFINIQIPRLFDRVSEIST